MGGSSVFVEGPSISRARQLLSLQAGRAVAAMLVVVHHAALLSGAFSFNAGRLGVEYFFVLSGIVILTAHWDDICNPHTFPSFAWKRFRRIYPVYWIVLLPQLLWIVASPRHENLYQRDPWVILSSILLVHLHSFHTTVTVAWTLFHEILFYAFFALMLLNRRIGSIAMALWLAASFFFFNAPNPYGANFFSPLHLIFGFGMVAAWIIRSSKIPWPAIPLASGVAIFVWACCIANQHDAISDQTNLLAGLGAMLATLGLVEFERRDQLHVYAWLTLLGDASYSIYLVHYPVLYALTPHAIAFLPQHHISLLATMILLTLLSTTAGLLFHLFVERPLLRWLGGFRHPALRTA
jgi:exopolysaccharide production protein ExoZ